MAESSKRARFTSGFLLLDVQDGRRSLAKRLAAGEEITVMIQATLQGALADPAQRARMPKWQPWSADDGESVEFAADVDNIYEIKPEEKK